MAVYDLDPMKPPELDDLEDAIDEMAGAIYSWRMATGRLVDADLMPEHMRKGSQTARHNALVRIKEILAKYSYTHIYDKEA